MMIGKSKFVKIQRTKYLDRVVAHFDGLINALHDLVEAWEKRNYHDI